MMPLYYVAFNMAAYLMVVALAWRLATQLFRELERVGRENDRLSRDNDSLRATIRRMERPEKTRWQ